MTDFDLIVIGTGTAGSTAATACAKEGWRVAIVDSLPYGGTCVLRGCDPKKILRRGAEIIDGTRLMNGKGLDPGTLSIDWPALVERKRGFTEPMSRKIEDGLESAGVEYTSAGVTVSDDLRSTSTPTVYAAGDAAATKGMPLTPVASIEGSVAADNMVKGQSEAHDYTGIPTAVSTIPELVRVGILEEEARDQGLDVDVRFSDSSEWFSNYRIGETTAAAKILVDRGTDQILGAHMLGPEYSEVVNLIALAMKLGLTVQDVKSMTAAYPSVGSDLSSML